MGDNARTWDNDDAWTLDEKAIAREVRRRLKEKNLAVAEGAPFRLPVAVGNPRAAVALNMALGWIAVLFLSVLALEHWRTACSGSVVRLSVAGLVVTAVAFPGVLRTQRSRTREEVTRQVRLAHVAGRYHARLCAVSRPGGAIDDQQDLLAASVLSPGTGQRWQVSDCFRSDDAPRLPAEWGNCGWVRDQDLACPQNYVLVAVPTVMPRIVLDAHATHALGSRLPALPATGRPLGIEHSFDHYFTVYAAPEDRSSVRDLLSEKARAELVAVARDWNIETTGHVVVFFRPGQAHWDQPGAWVAVEQLRCLVENVLAPRLGELAAPSSDHRDRRTDGWLLTQDQERDVAVAAPGSTSPVDARSVNRAVHSVWENIWAIGLLVALFAWAILGRIGVTHPIPVVGMGCLVLAGLLILFAGAVSVQAWYRSVRDRRQRADLR